LSIMFPSRASLGLNYTTWRACGENVAKIRKHTKTPVAVGFGVATPEDAARVAQVADGVIVGSAIVRRVGEHGQDGRLVQEVGAFVRSLKEAMQPG
jgi:tryptophan synthase alpha chain